MAKRTATVASDRGTAKWNETLTGFVMTPTEMVTFELFAQDRNGRKKLVGESPAPAQMFHSTATQEIKILYGGRLGSYGRISLRVSVAQAGQQRTIPAHERVLIFPSPSVQNEPSISPSSRILEDQPSHQPTESLSRREPASTAAPGLLPPEDYPDGRELSLSSPVVVPDAEPPRLASVIVDGAQLMSNIANTVIGQAGLWETLLGHVQSVTSILDKVSQVHPYASMAWSVLSAIPKATVQQIEYDANVTKLVEDLSKGFETLLEVQDLEKRCNDLKQAEIIARICQQTSECGSFIKLYFRNSNFWQRLVQNIVSGPDEIVQQYRTALDGLRRDFLERTAITTKICVLQITDHMERRFDQLSDQIWDSDATNILRDLPYGEGTRFDPSRRCLPGTRVSFLDEIKSWVEDPGSPQMLVLFGQAGMGKSTIASEIAWWFDNQGQLVSSFIFDRSLPQPPHLPITTLARDLCDTSLSFKHSLVEALRDNVTLAIGARDCATLFDRLLVQQLEKFTFVGNPVIVIDALDECGDEKQRRSLVSVLSQGMRNLPSNFRVLLTARPERDLESAFGSVSSIPPASVRIMRMDNKRLSASTEDDILEYTRSQLSTYIPDSDCQHVARMAGKLFQWASVACEFIVNPPLGRVHKDCLALILTKPMHDAQDKLDELYRT
ncbi:hypothetical protein K488DRAFT_91943, partial [Vararia minispora EC-137]